MALIKEVFPTPTTVSLSKPKSHHLMTIPESPTIIILNLPKFFPRSVKGRRLGILMLGMTSCGALPLSIIVDSKSRSSSPLDMIAWLAASSSNEPASEFLLEPALLSSDGGAGDPKESGVNGLEMVV
jgi:hypothetical protein